MIQDHFSPQGPHFNPPGEPLLPREAAHPQVPPRSGHGHSTHLPRLLSPCSGHSALSLGGMSLCVIARRTALVFRTKSKPFLIPTALWEAVLPSPQRPFRAQQCLMPVTPAGSFWPLPHGRPHPAYRADLFTSFTHFSLPQVTCESMHLLLSIPL